MRNYSSFRSFVGCSLFLSLRLRTAHIRLIELIKHSLDVGINLAGLLLLLTLLLVGIFDLQRESDKTLCEEWVRDQHQTLLGLHQKRRHLLPELSTE